MYIFGVSRSADTKSDSLHTKDIRNTRASDTHARRSCDVHLCLVDCIMDVKSAGAQRAVQQRDRGIEKHMRRRFLLASAVIGGLVGMLVATNLSIGPFNMRVYLDRVPRGPLLICAALIFLNELCKGARWGTFLRASGVRIRMTDAISTSMASQALTVMPCHDLLAARLVEEHRQGKRAPKMRQAAPALVARWIADAIALSIIVTIGVWYYKSFAAYTLIPVPVALGVAYVFRAKTPARWMARQLSRWSKTQKLVRSEADFHRASRRVMRFQPLAAGVLYSMCCTTLSALMLYTLVRGFGGTILSVPEALVAHALSTFAAMISFVPNGFGVADGSIAGWLHFFGVGARRVVLVTLTLRLINIVVRTAIGVATLLTRYRFMWEGGTRQLLRRVFSGAALRPEPIIAATLPLLGEPAEIA